MAPLLEIDDLVAGYGDTRVLNRVSISLEGGEAIAVLGANGAGKSTLMHTIAGLVTPWAGTIIFEGEEIGTVPAEDRPGLGLALTPEGRQIFASLSIEENLCLGGSSLKRRFGAVEARSIMNEGLERAYGLFPVLGERRRDPGSNLSGGQQQMLAIARALMSRPKLLLMDEPCLGLAPKVGNEVYGVLRTLREDGLSLIVVEESSRRALDFVDRACVLKLGDKVLEDTASVMQQDEQLLRAYFGIEEEAMAADE